MAALADLEKSLDEVFVKKAPPLPANAKKAVVEYLPWINAVLGVLALWGAYTLWHWAHMANNWVDYANSLSAAYGGPTVHTDRLGLGIWLSLIVLAAEAVLYIAAFPALQARKKSGWDLLFYAALFNAAYGVVVLFTDYGGVGQLIMSLVGSAIGLYFLFQIRDLYLGKKTVPATAAKAPDHTKHQAE